MFKSELASIREKQPRPRPRSLSQKPGKKNVHFLGLTIEKCNLDLPGPFRNISNVKLVNWVSEHLTFAIVMLMV